MKAFSRRPPPPFWIDRVCRFLDLLASGEVPAGNKLHDWSEQRRSLAAWFHESVRPPGEGAFCAYCDGLLGTQSPGTIDHWVPRDACRRSRSGGETSSLRAPDARAPRARDGRSTGCGPTSTTSSR